MLIDEVLGESIRIKTQIAQEFGCDSSCFLGAIREIELRYPERLVSSADQIPLTGGIDVPDDNPLLWEDSVIAEVHRIKDAIGQRYALDPAAYFARLRQWEEEHAGGLIRTQDANESSVELPMKQLETIH